MKRGQSPYRLKVAAVGFGPIQWPPLKPWHPTLVHHPAPPWALKWQCQLVKIKNKEGHDRLKVAAVGVWAYPMAYPNPWCPTPVHHPAPLWALSGQYQLIKTKNEVESLTKGKPTVSSTECQAVQTKSASVPIRTCVTHWKHRKKVRKWHPAHMRPCGGKAFTLDGQTLSTLS